MDLQELYKAVDGGIVAVKDFAIDNNVVVKLDVYTEKYNIIYESSYNSLNSEKEVSMLVVINRYTTEKEFQDTGSKTIETSVLSRYIVDNSFISELGQAIRLTREGQDISQEDLRKSSKLKKLDEIEANISISLSTLERLAPYLNVSEKDIANKARELRNEYTDRIKEGLFGRVKDVYLDYYVLHNTNKITDVETVVNIYKNRLLLNNTNFTFTESKFKENQYDLKNKDGNIIFSLVITQDNLDNVYQHCENSTDTLDELLRYSRLINENEAVVIYFEDDLMYTYIIEIDMHNEKLIKYLSNHYKSERSLTRGQILTRVLNSQFNILDLLTSVISKD